MNQQDRQAIEELFQHLSQTTAQAGPRDGDAEALIQQHVQQGPPGLLYHMAQTLVAQQHTLNQLRAQTAHQRQGGAPAGFAPPPSGYQQGGYQQGGYQQAYGQPQYQQGGWQQGGGYQQPGRQSGGFLGGAGKLALGIGGGILGAEVLTSIFDGVGGLFGDNRDRQYDDGYREGFAAGDDYRDQGDYQDPNGFNDGGPYGNDGYDGGYDSGGNDDGFF